MAKLSPIAGSFEYESTIRFPAPPLPFPFFALVACNVSRFGETELRPIHTPKPLTVPPCFAHMV
jgi:hypothetical protein